ncbi:hypothetical protein JCM19301_906 [Jejuia pallidilutea]|uniref:Uncharacterized protein n=1 Tax=Jejuia pallidilutea TaxID=504487 RepID=A0A090VWG4_9FLAO|nr:hypothetical protein JCM19301_906 [Jejuia pallidilutea]
MLFFIAEKSIYFLLGKVKNNQVDKRLEYVLDGKMNKDIVIFGSSIGAGNILAGEIQKAQNLQTYNLSYHGSDAVFHKFLLETLLKFNQAPKKVILVIDNPFYFKKEALTFRNDVLKPLSQYSYINNQLIENQHHSFYSKYLYLGRLNKDMLRFKRKNKNQQNPLDDYGSQPLLNLDKHPQSIAVSANNYSLEVEDPSKVEAFKAVQNLCKENGIELICVFTPSFRSHNTVFIKRFKALINKAVSRVYVYNVSNKAYKNKLNYYDAAHLNIKGAEILTSELNTYLSSLK